MKWRNSKERELLASGGTREQTLPNKNNPHPDLTDVGDPGAETEGEPPSSPTPAGGHESDVDVTDQQEHGGNPFRLSPGRHSPFGG